MLHRMAERLCITCKERVGHVAYVGDYYAPEHVDCHATRTTVAAVVAMLRDGVSRYFVENFPADAREAEDMGLVKKSVEESAVRIERGDWRRYLPAGEEGDECTKTCKRCGKVMDQSDCARHDCAGEEGGT